MLKIMYLAPNLLAASTHWSVESCCGLKVSTGTTRPKTTAKSERSSRTLLRGNYKDLKTDRKNNSDMNFPSTLNLSKDRRLDDEGTDCREKKTTNDAYPYLVLNSSRPKTLPSVLFPIFESKLNRLEAAYDSLHGLLCELFLYLSTLFSHRNQSNNQSTINTSFNVVSIFLKARPCNRWKTYNLHNRVWIEGDHSLYYFAMFHTLLWRLNQKCSAVYNSVRKCKKRNFSVFFVKRQQKDKTICISDLVSSA